MLHRLAYRYHRFLGIMFITIIGSGLIRVDFSKMHFNKSNTSDILLRQGELFSLKKANAWINSPSLTAADLKGKVVLIHFCTYTCINWLRTLPYIRAWAEKYKDKGLAIVEVHTPEFPFEKNIDNVRKSIKDMKIDFPIAIDNNNDIWNAFNNHYWPAVYLIDAKGYIRHHQFGEGEYEQSEKVIQQLLRETGAKDIDPAYVYVNARGESCWVSLNSSEIVVAKVCRARCVCKTFFNSAFSPRFSIFDSSFDWPIHASESSEIAF
jgi:thiol-disulfide isomerase/thioredoxin